MQSPFKYTPQIISTIEQALSPERFAGYLTLAGGNREDAARLYIWNAAVSESLYLPMQALEVTVRNAFHHELTKEYGADWFHSRPLGLRPNLQVMIVQAEQKLAQQGKKRTSGGLVAELSFGFWTGILGGHYEAPLWRYCLKRAFSHAPQPLLRQTAHKKLVALRQLRNRIAHHEPVVSRDLPHDYAAIIELLSWVHPDLAQWIDHHSRFKNVWRERP